MTEAGMCIPKEVVTVDRNEGQDWGETFRDFAWLFCTESEDHSPMIQAQDALWAWKEESPFFFHSIHGVRL